MKRAALLFSILSLLALATFAWADIHMVADPSVPAAQGDVSLGHDDNGNTIVALHIRHLARPSALTPARNNYVVWIQPSGQEPRNMGILAVDEDLRAEFRSVVPAKGFDIFVTAEDNPRPAQPSGTKVLRATVQP